MDNLGIESLTVFALPPVELVHLAADLDCRYISIGLAPFSSNPEGYPAWSLREPATRQAMKSALRERGVSISLGQGFAIRPDRDIRDSAADLDLMCELGVTRICSLSLDPDLGRSLDQIGTLAEMADRVGAEIVIEFVPTFTIPNLPAAISALRRIGRNNARLLIDTMHLMRSGGSAADVAALDPDLVGYAQLCDAPLVAKNPSYMEESVTERMVPGKGELPLRAILAALPKHVVIGLEIPLLTRARAGERPHERARDCVDGARKLLAALT
jgi:sugar phosphate isomerase/epimerase